jgi:ATP-dependent DNA ligase
MFQHPSEILDKARAFRPKTRVASGPTPAIWSPTHPPSGTRFGSLLVLSRVHWVEPKLVAEITYLTWTADSLLRHTVYIDLREDKPAEQVEAARSR